MQAVNHSVDIHWSMRVEYNIHEHIIVEGHLQEGHISLVQKPIPASITSGAGCVMENGIIQSNTNGLLLIVTAVVQSLNYLER